MGKGRIYGERTGDSFRTPALMRFLESLGFLFGEGQEGCQRIRPESGHNGHKNCDRPTMSTKLGPRKYRYRRTAYSTDALICDMNGDDWRDEDTTMISSGDDILLVERIIMT
jgi:hypothetical protein